MIWALHEKAKKIENRGDYNFTPYDGQGYVFIEPLAIQ
jgi:hypothetical protein